MIVFLKKVRVNTIFSAFEPVITEPLELCYLKTTLNQMNAESYIIDELFNLKEPELLPDIIVLTGYNVSENEIINNADFYRKKFPQAKIIVGGVHVQGNAPLFYKKSIDYVCHTQSLETFKCIIENIMNENNGSVDGADYYDKQKNIWHEGNKKTVFKKENITPDRSIFNKYSNKLRYLDKKNVVLIKGSIGCPYNCSYCYCKMLNEGTYIKADYKEILTEMKHIPADYFWVVDDVLFANRNDALDFIEAVKEVSLKLKIIAYVRADFILKEKDLLPLLKEAGLSEVIVGFETFSNNELKEYEKTTNALDYPEVIKVLRENNIDLTALFMVKPQYEIKDFWSLYKFIKINDIDVYTVSILTPIKGTKDYDKLKEKLTTRDPRKFDFLHLVLKPKLPRWLFYMLFYGIHIRLLKSKRIWKYLLELSFKRSF